MNGEVNNYARPVVFLSREGSLIGNAVKSLAKGFGVEWRTAPEYPLPSSASVVLVASTDAPKVLDELSSKCGVWDAKTMTACASYELVLEKSSQNTDKSVDNGESLTDWILTEIHYYGRHEICFEGPENPSLSELYIFERALAQTIHELIECHKNSIKHGEHNALVIQSMQALLMEQVAKDDLLEQRNDALDGKPRNGLPLEELDYLIGLFENGFDPMTVLNDHETRAWYDIIEYDIALLAKFFFSRDIGYVRWSYNDSPMMLACRLGKVDIVKTMLYHGWNPNHATDIDHESPLTCAAENGAKELFFMLLNYGAVLNFVGYDHELVTDPEGEQFNITPNDLLKYAKLGKCEDICQFLEKACRVS